MCTTVAPLDATEARDAFEARCLVEIECAGLAVVHASPDAIAAIRAHIDAVMIELFAFAQERPSLFADGHEFTAEDNDFPFG